MAKQRVLTDISDDKVDQVIADFVSDGCTASKKQQANGLWTVTANCPDSL